MDLYNYSNLRNNDLNLIQTLKQERLTNFSFEGIKRRLRLHPETLSRSISRLIDQEMILKDKKGYSLTSKAKEISEAFFNALVVG